MTFDSLNQNPIYLKSIRKAVAAFGTVFNEMWIVRTDPQGISKSERVQLGYGPKEYWVDRRKSKDAYSEEQGAASEFSHKWPFLSYTITSFDIDRSRQKNSMNKLRGNVAGQPASITSPVPINLEMKLSIYSKNIEDSLMLLEQIVPLFQPQINIKIREVEQMGISTDTTIILNSVLPDDNYMSGIDENRMVVWDLSFTMRTHCWPPFKIRNSIIEGAIIDTVPVVDVGVLEQGECCPCESYTQEDIDRIMQSNTNKIIET